MTTNTETSSRALLSGECTPPAIDLGTPDDRLAVKPRVACLMLGCGITRLYELLNRGELTHYKDGRSRLILTGSIRAYISRLASASAKAA